MAVEAHDFEWFLRNERAYDSLTVEQVEALARGETIEYGDTDKPDSTEPPASADVTDTTPNPQPTVAPDDDPVVLTKDGKHTIPFEEFRAAKDRAQAAEDRLAELDNLAKEQAQLIDKLQAAKTADEGTGDTSAQEEVWREFKEEWPEFAEKLQPAINRMLSAKDAEFAGRLEALENKFNDALTPLQKSNYETAVDGHFKTIYAAIPDFDALVESGAVDKWIETLPSYARSGAEHILAEGTATEIVELFNQYKTTLAAPEPSKGQSAKADIKAAADAAIAKAKTPRPVSLTDVPAGSVSTHDEEPTTTEGWSRKFAGMTPEQILKML